MTTYREIELKKMMEICGHVDIDVVPHDGSDPTCHRYTHFETCKAEIAGFENENEVYF